MSHDYMPTEKVKTCKFIESGIAFEPDGIFWCCNCTITTPRIFSAEELSKGLVSRERIIEKRKEFFSYLNTKDRRAGSCLRCKAVYETEFKNVQFDKIEGWVNIQPFTLCNLRCKYCLFTQRNTFEKPLYNVSKVLELLSSYQSVGKLGSTWLSVNGGEPAILKDFGEFCEKLAQLDLANVCIFSNCVKYDQKFADLLRKDDVFLTVSLDCGIPTTFAEVRGAPAMWKVVDTIIRYRKTGTHRLWIKYIITKDNCNEDNLFSFVFLMAALRPDIVYICPEFPYGDRETPHDFVLFGARMWYLLKKYADLNIHIQTDDNNSDPKFKKYSEDIRSEFAKITHSQPLDSTYVLPNPETRIREITNFTQKTIEHRQLESFKKLRSQDKYAQTVDKVLSFLRKKDFDIFYIRKSLLFDEEYYLSQFDKSEREIIGDCINHYCTSGWKCGKNPARWFDTNRYLLFNPDVKMNPFYHYLRYGLFEDRKIC